MKEIYWKDLVLDKNKYDIENVKEFKDKDEVEFQCQICGKSFTLKGRVFKRRFDSDGYFRRTIFACQSSECLHKKKSMVGHSEKVITGARKGSKIACDNKRGKTFEELYGAEEAEKKLAKIRKARAAQTGTEHDPRLGKKHSEESKKKMSENKKLLMQSSEKKYVSRITGDLITYKEYTEETLMLTNNLGNKYKWGEFENWYSGKIEIYDSSYELAFMLKAKDNKIIYEKNTKFRLSYQIDGVTHSYIPDFFTFEEGKSELILKSIVEIKSKYAKSNKTEAKVLKEKLISLRNYCLDTGISGHIYFEDELGKDYLRKALKYHENQKLKNKKIR